MTAGRPRYVFVGAFQPTSHDGGFGGQPVACLSLLRTPLSDLVQFTTIDSTAASSSEYSVARRGLAAARRLRSFAAEIIGPDVVGALIFSSASFSFVEKGTMALLAKRLGRRVVFFPRSGLLLDDLDRSPWMRRFVPYVLRRCDVVVCQGRSWDQLFASMGVPASQRVVVPNWLDTAGYAGDRPPRSEQSPLTVLFMGRLEQYKGILDLIEAVHRERSRLGGVKFVVCGGGGEAARVQQRLAEYGLSNQFELRGWVGEPEKSQLFRSADLFVLPSRREGMPNALLEAMAAGLPIIATRVGGVPDIIEDESIGVLVEPGDTAGLGQALVALCNDRERRRSLGAAAARRVIERHDVRTLWRQLLGLMLPSHPDARTPEETRASHG